ncbi:16173_t:CDS:2, partial [Acaulospora colombiana]
FTDGFFFPSKSQAAKWVKAHDGHEDCTSDTLIRVDADALSVGAGKNIVSVNMKCSRVIVIISHGINEVRPQFFIPLKAGHERDGKELYIAKSSGHIGKAGRHLIEGMSYACDGREVTSYNYEVLGFAT